MHTTPKTTSISGLTGSGPGWPESPPPTGGTDLRIDLDRRPGDLLVVHIQGDVDIVTAPELRRYVDLAELGEGRPRGLVLDLSGVGFLGSSGLSVLVALAQDAPACHVAWAVVATGRAVLRPIEATGLLDVVPVYPDVDAALAAVRAG